MAVRRVRVFLCFFLLMGFLVVLMFVHAGVGQRASAASLRDTRRLVSRLGLTDLCLFTEANFTRHPSQADLHTAFQDGPSFMDHFPSGALLTPPPGIRRSR
jgi:hypothetical protein